jgi:hypothetical protein
MPRSGFELIRLEARDHNQEIPRHPYRGAPEPYGDRMGFSMLQGGDAWADSRRKIHRAAAVTTL